MVAALRDLEISKVPRRELDALRRHQADEGIMRRRQLRMHGRHHLVECMRTRHRKDLGMGLANDLGTRAQATGHDDATVGVHRLADRIERLLDRVVDKAAGVDDDQIGILVARRDAVALRTQLREDPLRIHRRLGTAEADESDLGGLRHRHGVNRDLQHSKKIDARQGCPNWMTAKMAPCGSPRKANRPTFSTSFGSMTMLPPRRLVVATAPSQSSTPK